MSYTYGTKGAPAVGGGVPGLPVRDTGVGSIYTPASARSIYYAGARVGYSQPLNVCYSTKNTTLFCFDLSGVILWSVDLGVTNYTVEYTSYTTGVKIYTATGTVASFDAYGNLQWQTTLTGVGTILAGAQGDLSDNTYVLTNTSGTNTWITKLSPSGAVLWSYSFGSLTNPTLTGTCVAPNGDVWFTVQSVVTNFLVDAYKVSVANGGTIPKIRISNTGVPITGGNVAVDSSGNIFIAASANSASTAHLNVYNSAYTKVAGVQRRAGTPQAIYAGAQVLLGTDGSVYGIFGADVTGTQAYAPYIVTYSFTAPSTLTYTTAIYGSPGTFNTGGTFDNTSFYDAAGSIWLTDTTEMLRIGSPLTGSVYKNIQTLNGNLTFLTDTSTSAATITSASTTPVTTVAAPGSSAGTLSPVLTSASTVIGQTYATTGNSFAVSVVNS